MRCVNNLKTSVLIIVLFISFGLIDSYAEETESNKDLIRLYIDADFSNSSSSSLAIKNGILTALLENENAISGHPVDLVILDHHGNARRSKNNLLKYDSDTNALAVYCGLHSSPVLSNSELINKNEILLLDPWAAASPITRRPDDFGRNWVFRLSVDDTKAGEFLVQCAIDHEKFSKPVMLLEDTPWGKSNRKTVTSALIKRGVDPSNIYSFNWKLRASGSSKILSDIYKSGADVILLVANAPEGESIMKAMAERKPEERLPIRSHWGITGGNLFNSLGENIIIDQLDLKFIQTSFSFIDKPVPQYAEKVFELLQQVDPTIMNPEDLRAPVGFIHAYDLTKLLITAVESIEWQGSAADNRDKVRDALENITVPVRGLVKVYVKPFRAFLVSDPDAHEALSENDFKMAEYERSGAIKLIKNKGNENK